VRKDIVTDRSQGSDWVVMKGLAAGDQVIVSGVQRAQPGQPAKAVPYQADAGKAAAPAAKKEGEQGAAAAKG